MKLLLVILLSAGLPAVAAPVMERSAHHARVSLDNGTKLEFAVADGQLRGLHRATVDGVALKSDATVVRPFLIQEWVEKPLAWEGLKLANVTVAGQTVRIECELLATDDPAAARRFFVFQGDRPHLDYYRFAHVRLPAEICGTNTPIATGRVAGKLTWVIEPVTLNVAGWEWRGWKHHYEVELDKPVNCLRELGTWELGGHATGTTLVNLRYRGLGGIVGTVDSNTAFTTTEILPGAVDKAPVVSPAVPGPQNIAGRAEALKYRHGAWIAQLQRGAGVNWVDFQYRPEAALAAWYERMTAVRSLTEVWPGDPQVSQTDGLYFARTNRFTTAPKIHVALTTKLPEHEWRTRWQEMDQFVRDHLSRQLNFVQTDALPSVGINIDSGWEMRLKQLIGQVDAWKAAGVKRVLVHHPGWFNGRGLRQKETPFEIPLDAEGKPDTGGDCSIHDYVPQSDKVRELWTELTGKLNAAGMEYWVWITGMVYGTGPVVKQFGVERFTRNSPDVDFSSGYPGKPPKAGHRGISMRDAELRRWFEDRMTAAIKDLGVRGFWADSFQNMFMSQMNYQRADWSPQVAEYWQWIAAASRQGAGFMAESTAFPGLSCSIEVGGNPSDFEDVWWTLPHVTRWYRGEKVPHAGTERADRLFFRSMANKGPICPGGDIQQVPGYARLAAQYNAVVPKMKRPYQLPNNTGVLWLTERNDNEGVLFDFANQTVSDVTDKDLLAKFGLRRGPEKDPRLKP
jgi:hypothetical protein